MDYFYSAAVMGYGFGRSWHKKYNFPNFPRVTQTLTEDAYSGNPHAVLPFRRSVWNRVALHNMGFYDWYDEYGERDLTNITVSLAGKSPLRLSTMIHDLNYYGRTGGLELNYSCPNVDTRNGYVPLVTKKVDFPVYLKLRYDDDPYTYDLSNITGIRLNSVPFMYGGVSGKMAQKKNWSFIRRYGKGLNVAGCSFTCEDDIKKLEDMGCTEIGIGSTILTNPRLIERLENG